MSIFSANKKESVSARWGKRQKQQKYLKSNPPAESKCQTPIKQILVLCTGQFQRKHLLGQRLWLKGVVNSLFTGTELSTLHINWITSHVSDLYSFFSDRNYMQNLDVLVNSA